MWSDDSTNVYFRFSQSTEFSRVYINESKSAVSQKIVLSKPIALLVHGWTDKFDSIFLRVNGKGKTILHISYFVVVSLCRSFEPQMNANKFWPFRNREHRYSQ